MKILKLALCIFIATSAVQAQASETFKNVAMGTAALSVTYGAYVFFNGHRQVLAAVKSSKEAVMGAITASKDAILETLNPKVDTIQATVQQTAVDVKTLLAQNSTLLAQVGQLQTQNDAIRTQNIVAISLLIALKHNVALTPEQTTQLTELTTVSTQPVITPPESSSMLNKARNLASSLSSWMQYVG